MQLARRSWVEEHVNARDPLADGELMDRRLLRPAARCDLRIVAVERILEVRHRLDVFGIMIGDLGARRQLHRVTGISAFARLAMIASLCGVRPLRQREPTCAKRSCGQKSTACSIHGNSSCRTNICYQPPSTIS